MKLSRFHSLTVLSEEAVASWRQSGLSRHLSTYLPASRRPYTRHLGSEGVA